MRFASTAIALALAVACPRQSVARVLDGVRLGDTASETAHAFPDRYTFSYAEKGAQWRHQKCAIFFHGQKAGVF